MFYNFAVLILKKTTRKWGRVLTLDILANHRMKADGRTAPLIARSLSKPLEGLQEEQSVEVK